MKLDDETRIILGTRLKLTNEEIDKYEKGYLSLSHDDERVIRSAKLARKISEELSDVAPILDKCDVFNANKLLFNISHKIGDEHGKHLLTSHDHEELMIKLDEYNIAGKMICECKNKVSRK